jgi:hypothetical protein
MSAVLLLGELRREQVEPRRRREVTQAAASTLALAALLLLQPALLGL